MRVPRTVRGWAAIADDDYGITADEVFVTELPTHSCVLGPDGEPIEYEPPPAFGFELRRRSNGR